MPAITPDGSNGSVLVHQDARVYVSRLEKGRSLEHKFGEGSGAYLFLIEGAASFGGSRLTAGEAARIWMEPRLAIEALDTSELVMMEVQV